MLRRRPKTEHQICLIIKRAIRISSKANHIPFDGRGISAVCTYLKPSKDKKAENIGLNDVVPQATGAGMPDDKARFMSRKCSNAKEQGKRNALTTLSDYWNTEDSCICWQRGYLPDEDESNGFRRWWQNFRATRQSCIKQLP